MSGRSVADDPAMRLMLLLITLSALTFGQSESSSKKADAELPDSIEAICARSPEFCDNFDSDHYNWHPYQRHPNPGFFAWGGDLDGDAWPLRTNHELFHNRIFLVSHAIWLSSIVYDIELTHQGLAHHNCVEGNLNAGEHPGRTELYVGSIPTTALMFALDIFWTKYLFQPNAVIGPVIGSAYHFRGGSQWLLNCW
jgi:hypothetical protein